MAKDGYKFVRDRRNVTFLNTSLSRFTYINQLLNIFPHNTGSVEVNGSTPLGSTIYSLGDDLHRPPNPAFAGFFVSVCLVYFHILQRDRNEIILIAEE